MEIRKLLSTLLLAVLCLTFVVGCKDSEKTTDKALNVAIVQAIDNTSFTDMREGFISQMREYGYYGDNVNYYFKDAQGDPTVLNTIAQEVMFGDYDIIVAIATTAAQALVNTDSDKPVFFMCVIDPLGARLTTSLEKPDRNTTGTSNEVPYRTTFEIAKKITPEVQSYGLLYTPAEVNAVTVINAVKEYFDEINMPYKEAIIANAAEAQQAAQSLIGSVDAIFVPVDATAQAAMPSIAEVAIEAGIPLYSSASTNVRSGAFATLSTPDAVLGEVAADMVQKYLNGTAISDIPMQVIPATDLLINERTANLLNITIPAELNAKMIN